MICPSSQAKDLRQINATGKSGEGQRTCQGQFSCPGCDAACNAASRIRDPRKDNERDLGTVDRGSAAHHAAVAARCAASGERDPVIYHHGKPLHPCSRNPGRSLRRS